MSTLRRLALASCVTLASALPASAQDAPPPPHPLVGEWRLVAGQGGVIPAAIDNGIARMNFVTRPIARRRLTATNDAYATIELRLANAEVTTILAGRTVSSPSDGRAIRWTREDGETMQLSTAVRDLRLVQTFVAEDGRRENVYSVSPDGRRLMLDVTLTSERLPAPVTYRLLYDRVP